MDIKTLIIGILLCYFLLLFPFTLLAIFIPLFEKLLVTCFIAGGLAAGIMYFSED